MEVVEEKVSIFPSISVLGRVNLLFSYSDSQRAVSTTRILLSWLTLRTRNYVWSWFLMSCSFALIIAPPIWESQNSRTIYKNGQFFVHPYIYRCFIFPVFFSFGIFILVAVLYHMIVIFFAKFALKCFSETRFFWMSCFQEKLKAEMLIVWLKPQTNVYFQDTEKAEKLKQSLPPGLQVKELK